MKTKHLTVNGRKLKIFDCQGRSKKTILAIHGLSGNGHSLQYYAKEFSKDYRFISMDLYGRGGSQENGTSSHLLKHAQDIIELIDILELEEVILMGYSMGAFISSLVASQTNKVKVVILLDGFATMSDHQRPIIEPSLGRLSQPYSSKDHSIEETIASYLKLGITDRLELRKLLAYEIEEKNGIWKNKASEEIIRKDWETFWEVDIYKTGEKITQPVLLVIALGNIGEHPPLFLPEHYEGTIEAIENIEVVTTEANNYTMGFNPQKEINQAIASFLERING